MTKSKPIQVPFAIKVKVANWLLANKERLLEKRPTYSSLAKDITHMFETEVEAHVLTRMLEQLDMKYEPVRVGMNNAGGGAKFQAMTERIDALSSQVESLGLIVEQLTSRLDKLLLDLGTERLRIMK